METKNIILKLRTERGMSQDELADKIMVIEDGEVKKYGTKEDVFPTLFQQEK